MKRSFASGYQKRKKKKLLEAKLSNLPQINSYFKIPEGEYMKEDLFIRSQPDVPTISTDMSTNIPTDTASNSETADCRTEAVSPIISQDSYILKNKQQTNNINANK